MTKRDWIVEEVIRLIDMYKEGKTQKEIAKILDRPEGSVGVKLRALGLRKRAPTPTSRLWRSWTEEEYAVLREMYHEGHSKKYMARVLKRSIPAVATKIFELGLTKLNKG